MYTWSPDFNRHRKAVLPSQTTEQYEREQHALTAGIAVRDVSKEEYMVDRYIQMCKTYFSVLVREDEVEEMHRVD